MAFNFTDYMAYSSNSSANVEALAVVTKGVLQYLVNVHQIDLSPKSGYIFTQTLEEDEVEFTLDFMITAAVTSITQDGNPITFTQTNSTITLDSVLTDYTLPLEVTVDLTYDTEYDDLKLAIYRHIDYVYTSIDLKTDNIAKTVNTDGNTSYYRDDVIPKASLETYMWYTKRPLVTYG